MDKLGRSTAGISNAMRANESDDHCIASCGLCFIRQRSLGVDGKVSVRIQGLAVGVPDKVAPIPEYSTHHRRLAPRDSYGKTLDVGSTT